jgi:hypothetical protein
MSRLKIYSAVQHFPTYEEKFLMKNEFLQIKKENAFEVIFTNF